ncbi:MAG: hypothetical protein J0H52_17455, partial [Comamonadaceae bacterium]|nr:hypothetical protein [Comamonadaceae bacterium]
RVDLRYTAAMLEETLAPILAACPTQVKTWHSALLALPGPANGNLLFTMNQRWDFQENPTCWPEKIRSANRCARLGHPGFPPPACQEPPPRP